MRELAKRFDRSKNTIQRHVAQHIPAAVQKAAADAADEREIDAGDSILDEIARLMDNAKRLQRLAEGKKDYRTAVSAAREWREIVELQARLLGELRDREINITNVQIDTDTATRMAQMFLARRQARTITAGAQPVAALQVAKNE